LATRRLCDNQISHFRELQVSTNEILSKPATPIAASHPLANLETQIDQLRMTGAMFYQRGWSVGTSSNYSVVLDADPLELLLTASGRDKGRLTRTDFVRVGSDGQPTVPDQPKSSAETLLHIVVASERTVGAILHTHSPWATELSQLYFDRGGIDFEGYEMLKGLDGIKTHEYRFRFEIFENTQEIPLLADQVRRRLTDADNPLQYGYLIRGHGLYTWGRDVDEARRHVEILEFLLECKARRIQLTGKL
jgi:methylthioribulose-1-phosphate dehydratase